MGPGAEPVLVDVDAVTLAVPDLDAGLRVYRDALGHRLLWRNDATGQAALGTARGTAEIVLTTRQSSAPNWLVRSADAAAEAFVGAGGRVLVGPTDIPVGRLAVVADPFDNVLVLVDLTKGTYTVDAAGDVTGVEP
ncbi:VOC family protein [Actinotalea ferrariae]|uniref:VOC family protein n=1 Tax=Actinotalea ferrariae TaxID=1386098 RepID=UPI001C8CD2B0|nr:VOC family protein [Actinotalea ferrariae]MBX9244408.1 VOC family protein [Actinotalea ferrariae]